MTFPLATPPRKGYLVSAVDDFVRRAQGAGTALTSEEIRGAHFPLAKGGYDVARVDAILEQLEDTVSDAERRSLIAQIGYDAATAQARSLAQEILNRIARPAGHRFTRAPFFTYGYDRHEVDEFTDRIRAFYADGTSLSRADVRAATFRPRLGGYDERQVDLVLEALVRVMLAAR